MARPSKNNADYFSHDADMRNDVKVKALRRRFSHKGYAVWCFMLEVLTDSDFFEVSFDEVNQELLAADFDVSVEELREIVEYCQKIGLLQSTQDGKVFSEAHQRRFSGLLTKRERDRERIARLAQEEKQAETEVIATEKPVLDSSRPDNSHSKVKENRVKENREKETKIEKYPYQDIIAVWNSVCLSLPKVLKVTEARKQKMKCRFQEFGVKPDELKDFTMRLFQRVQASDFLTGRSTGKMGWCANFDWVFENPSNWVKVSEGNYDNNRGGGSTNTEQKPVQAADGSQVQLGVGEYIDGSGRRTYGTGRANIPMTAAPRPSERYSWDAASNSWVML